MTTQLFSQVPVLMASFTTTTDTLTCVLLVQSSMGSRKISLSVWFDHQHAKLAVPCNQKIDCNADLGSLVRSRQYGWHKSQLLLILADTESPGSSRFKLNQATTCQACRSRPRTLADGSTESVVRCEI